MPLCTVPAGCRQHRALGRSFVAIVRARFGVVVRIPVVIQGGASLLSVVDLYQGMHSVSDRIHADHSMAALMHTRIHHKPSNGGHACP